MKKVKSIDLETVRKEIEAWRAHRKGRERIPERFWNAAIALIETFPFTRISRELNLNLRQLRKRCEAAGITIRKNRKHKQNFLEVSSQALTTPISIASSESAENIQLSIPTC